MKLDYLNELLSELDQEEYFAIDGGDCSSSCNCGGGSGIIKPPVPKPATGC